MNFKQSQAIVWTTLILAVATAVHAQGRSSRSSRTSPSNPSDPFESFKIITEKNIFDPNRIPVRRGGYTPPKVVDTFSLTGTMSFDDGLFAFFDGNNTAYHKVLQKGGAIAGYAVAEITHDEVKLVSGTNELELKVGMQMRRSDAGKWSVSESSGSYTFASGNSRFGNSGFSERNNRRFGGFDGGRNNNFNNFRNRSRDFNGYGNGGMQQSLNSGETTSLPADDSSDPVARLIRRRAQELGQSVNEGEPTPVEQVEPGGNTNTDQNGPGEGATPDQTRPGQGGSDQENQGNQTQDQGGAPDNSNGNQQQ